MFTGLIEEIGTVRSAARSGSGARVTVAAGLASALNRGDSVAVDGACLTVTGVSAGAFEADVSGETLSVTTARAWRGGERVNVERALRAGDRLGGHMVSGHIDGVGAVTRRTVRGDYVEVEITPQGSPPGAILLKGSVAVDGISLTVSMVDGGRFAVTLVPETLKATTLGDKAVGSSVNIETDLVGKYVEHFLAARPARHGVGAQGHRLRDLLDAPIEEGG